MTWKLGVVGLELLGEGLKENKQEYTRKNLSKTQKKKVSVGSRRPKKTCHTDRVAR